MKTRMATDRVRPGLSNTKKPLIIIGIKNITKDESIRYKEGK